MKWSSSHGTYIAGCASRDGADAMAIDMERKWGAGRLRLLVDVAMREKFDRQRYKYNAALWNADLPTLQEEAARMVIAYNALDRAAEAAGALKLDPRVWEATLADGTVLALVRDMADAHAVVQDGRKMVVFAIGEIVAMLDNYREVIKVKEAIPGTTVETIRRDIEDPLDAIRDAVSLNDSLDDILPQYLT
jgi:hypothetical protein